MNIYSEFKPSMSSDWLEAQAKLANICVESVTRIGATFYVIISDEEEQRLLLRLCFDFENSTFTLIAPPEELSIHFWHLQDDKLCVSDQHDRTYTFYELNDERIDFSRAKRFPLDGETYRIHHSNPFFFDDRLWFVDLLDWEFDSEDNSATIYYTLADSTRVYSVWLSTLPIYSKIADWRVSELKATNKSLYNIF